MRRRLLRALVICCALNGCVASNLGVAADPESCDRTCAGELASCKASCLKMTDPSGKISGSADSCARACSTDYDLCDLNCVKAKRGAAR